MPRKDDQVNPEFTPDEYYNYLKRPKWKDDSDEFENYGDYEAYWCALIEDWLDESKEHFRNVKKEWAHSIRRFEQFMERMREISSAKADPAYTQLPLLYDGVNELVALLFDSLPRPQYQSRQATEDDFTGALNYFANWELDACGFDITMYDVGLDVQLCNLGIVKTTVDVDQSGPFNQEGRIVIRRIEPRYFHPDPLAQKADWEFCKYWIFAEPYDLADIRRMYPMTGQDVEPESEHSTARAEIETEEDYDSVPGTVMKSPSNALRGPHTIGRRGRAMVKECWLHDESLEFIPEMEWVDNIAADGTEKVKGLGRGYERPRTDSRGKVIGAWKPRYPNGRLIVVANGVLLLDIPNPYRHKKPPYTLFRGRPSKKILSPGDVTFMIIVEKKINDLLTRIMRMAQCNIERPKIIDTGAFDSPKKWSNIEGAAEVILQMRPNSRATVFEAGDLPTFVSPFLHTLFELFDKIKGVTALQQGKIADGAQIGMQALQDMRDQGGSRIRMKARFLETGLREVGYQLMWLIRQTYPEQYQVMIMNPTTGQPAPVMWDNSKAQDDYAVIIQAGSSLPGAKQGTYQQALQLLRDKVVDDEYVLDVAQVPGKEKIIQRKRQKQLQDLETQAAGRAMGLQIKEDFKTNGQPGRTKENV